MYEFEPGDMVRVPKAGNKTGTVIDFTCEYGEHLVYIQFDDGSRSLRYQDFEVENLTDHYEYAVKYTNPDGYTYPLSDKSWTTLDEAKAELAHEEETNSSEPEYRWSMKLVKRLKAGKIEEV